ncbi:MAG: hypothetical protein ACPGTU_03985 [Myxococcota bacterium]
MSSLLIAVILGSTAHAVPAQFTHQGRLLGEEGVALEGDTTITFRVTNAESDGEALWEESLTIDINNGFYSTVLGTDEETNPLNVEIFNQAPLWLEVQLEGESPMTPRTPILSVPYAAMATVAEEVAGGPVDASSVSVAGTPVINDVGEWVGASPTVSWSDIEGMPEDFADGVDDDTDTDTDTLADLAISCIDGDVPVWDAAVSEWSCGWDHDTLADLECLEGQLVRWSDESTGWVCGDDTDTVLSESDVDAMVADNGYAMSSEIFTGSFLDLVDVPEGLEDGDDNTQLSEDEVDEMVSNNGYADAASIFSGIFSDLTGIPSDLSDGDDDTLNSLSCDVGAIAVQTESGWACSTIVEQMDSDGDGIPTWSDCDDTDPGAGSSTFDGDCDGTVTDDDCDDSDASSTTTATDGDCDGILTDDDCDDGDATSTSVADDADCDGLEAADDCDDGDSSSASVEDDADCDGIPSAYDCNPDDVDDSITESALLGSSSACPVSSCADAKSNHDALFPSDTWAGGYYHLGEVASSAELYCEPSTDGGDPWTFVVNFDASTDDCPALWTSTSMGSTRLCSRNSSGVRTHTFTVPELEFSEMKGNINGAMQNSVDGFLETPLEDISRAYADGIGVRMGSTHLYTFALGHATHHCTRSPPSFVGDDYTCTIGSRSGGFTGLYGTGWWESSFGSTTASDIQVQLMADQDTSDEDVAINLIQLKIR